MIEEMRFREVFQDVLVAKNRRYSEHEQIKKSRFLHGSPWESFCKERFNVFQREIVSGAGNTGV